jgi:hypothetical protein
VVAPNITTKTRLATIQVAPTVNMVSDAGGVDLTSYGDVGLTNIANLIMKAAPSGGSPGLNVEIQTTAGKTAGKAMPNSQAVILSPKNISTLATTINASAESDAQTAVRMHNNSSMVVIQPSTGKILAIANHDGFNDFALTAAVAPGSAM